MAVDRRAFLASSALTGLSLAAPGAFGALTRPQPPRKLKLLVLGGTAFLGPAFIDVALERGHEVAMFNRGRTRPNLYPDLEKFHGNRDPKLRATDGDETSPLGLTELEEAIKSRRWDAVIDNSGYVPRIVKASADLLRDHVEQYLFISTVSVYADNSKIGVDEDDALATMPDPTSEDVRANYGALKALCEQAAEASMPGRVTTVRPGLIVGPGDWTGRWLYWPVRLSEGGEVLGPGDGTDPIQIIDVRDLGEFMVRLVEQRTFGTFNAIGPKEVMTAKQMLEWCREGVKSDATITWTDADFLQAQGVSAWGDMPAWIPARDDYAGIGKRSIARAVKAGLTFRPIADTAAAALAWYMEQPEDRRPRFRGPFTLEREKAVLDAWKSRSTPRGG